jgi:hypothetical protein
VGAGDKQAQRRMAADPFPLSYMTVSLRRRIGSITKDNLTITTHDSNEESMERTRKKERETIQAAFSNSLDSYQTPRVL